LRDELRDNRLDCTTLTRALTVETTALHAEMNIDGVDSNARSEKDSSPQRTTWAAGERTAVDDGCFQIEEMYGGQSKDLRRSTTR
jgi:hypothetical protein